MVKIRENIVKNKMMLLQLSVNQLNNHMKITSNSCDFDNLHHREKSRENDVKNHVKSREKSRENIVKSREKHSENNVNFTKSLFQQLDFECFKKHEHEKRHEKDMIKTSSSCQIDMNFMSSTRARVFDTVIIYIVLNTVLNTVLYRLY